MRRHPVEVCFARLPGTALIIIAALSFAITGCNPKPPPSGSHNRNESGEFTRDKTPATLEEIMAAAEDPNSSIEAIEHIAGVPRQEIILKNGEPAYITVQHCLVSFAGTQVPMVSRSEEEARELAGDIFERAKSGEDFQVLVNEFSDDEWDEAMDGPKGIYQMANYKMPGNLYAELTPDKVFPRLEMVAAFGDVGFKLNVGEYGMAEYNLSRNEEGREVSPYGWHIIKRLK